MTVSDKEAKEFNKMLDKMKESKKEPTPPIFVNEDAEYCKAFLKLFYKNKIEDDKKKK